MNNNNVGLQEVSTATWEGAVALDEMDKPGGKLMAMLLGTARSRGHTLNEMAVHLGVTLGYINQLRNGIRKVSQISDDFAQLCASYLGLPRIRVLFAAGRIRVEDLFDAPQNGLHSLRAAIGYIVADSAHQALFPDCDLQAAPPAMQLYVVKLYEKVTGLALLPLLEGAPGE